MPEEDGRPPACEGATVAAMICDSTRMGERRDGRSGLEDGVDVSGKGHSLVYSEESGLA